MDYKSGINRGGPGSNICIWRAEDCIWTADDCYPAELLNWLEQQTPPSVGAHKAVDFSFADA